MKPPVGRAAPLQVMLATPYGQDGMGGIDRLNDAIADGFAADPQQGIRCTRLVTRGKGSLWAAQAVFAAALARFAAAAFRRDVDLLHIHLSVRGSSCRKAILARLARLLGVPYVLHLHGTDYAAFWHATHPLLRAELGRMFAGSARILVLGEFWARVMRDLVPEAANKVSILPNATAMAGPRPRDTASGGPRITFLGQLGPRKGSADLLEALALLRHVPGWSAALAGDGAIAETRSRVARLGLAERVAVPGWISTAERAALLDDSDMLVLPSHAENLPMVILEAFAHGVPVVSTPVGAIPEVVHDGRNGLLVTPGDVPALAAAIESLLRDPAARVRMGAAARHDHAQSFEIGRYLQRLSQLWREAAFPASTIANESHAHSS